MFAKNCKITFKCVKILRCIYTCTDLQKVRIVATSRSHLADHVSSLVKCADIYAVTCFISVSDYS